LLELPLPGIEAELVQRLDRVLHASVDIDGLVYHTVGADSKDFCQLDTAREELSETLFRRVGSA